MTDEELIAVIRSAPWSDGFPYLRLTADRIEALKTEVARLKAGWEDANAAALTNAYDLYAAEAAAYEAAGEIAAEFIHRRLYEANMPVCSYHSRDIKTAIRALATPDQTAALDRMRAEANAEGMRAAYDSLFKHPGFLHQISGQTFKAVKLEDAAEGILAAIPKEGV